jgi:hypothetical protein
MGSKQLIALNLMALKEDEDGSKVADYSAAYRAL